MQIHIEDVSPVEKKLDVQIPWERVKDRLDAAYKELGKGVEIRGFRKGKAPRSVIERMFGKKVQLEVAKELVQESFLAAAREHRLEPVAEPVVEDAAIRPGEAFHYTARVEVRGPVEIAQWEGLEVARRRIEVTDEDVARALEHKRRLHTELKPITERDRLAETDVAILAVKGTVGEHPIDRPELTIDLTEPELEPLPGLRQALLGLPLLARDHEITLEIPADHPQKEIAGRTARLSVTVRDAREKSVPELDDEFAKDTGEADTLEELRGKLRAELEQKAREREERQVREATLAALVEKNPIPVAPALVERAIDGQIQRTRMTLAWQGIDLERSGVDLAEMRERFRESALREVRGQLLLEALAERQGIEVSDAEVDAQVAEMARVREKPVQKVRAEMEHDGRLDSLRWRLRLEKALDLVVSRATITEAPAEPAEER